LKQGVSFVLVAAGKGNRLGGTVPKQYAEVAGAPLWTWSALVAESLSMRSLVDELVLVVPPEDIENL
jgi:2-C-methyl-D-erythritol 4-phosphate cytidylyltransferase